jgi:hypothetical protein
MNHDMVGTRLMISFAGVLAAVLGSAPAAAQLATGSVAVLAQTAEQPPVIAPPAPPPPAPPPEMSPEFKKIDMGFATRVGGRFQNRTDPRQVDDFGLDEIFLEARFHGQLHPLFAWQMNFNAFVPTNPPEAMAPASATGVVDIEDVIAKFELDPVFHLWAGRMLIPSDRANFSGPWFQSPWKYPGLDYPTAAPVGPKSGPFGRDNGLTAWGELLEGRAKYYLGAYGLNNAAAHPLYSGRVSFCLLGKEPGYYSASTYYGAQDIAALGVGFQSQADALGTPPAPLDHSLFNADLLLEKNLGARGVATFEAAYYHFSRGNSVRNAFFVLGSWLTPEKIGIGKLQPLIRWQQTTDPGWKIFDAYLNYVIDSYFLRVALGFEHTDFGARGAGNSVLLGIQLQR